MSNAAGINSTHSLDEDKINTIKSLLRDIEAPKITSEAEAPVAEVETPVAETESIEALPPAEPEVGSTDIDILLRRAKELQSGSRSVMEPETDSSSPVPLERIILPPSSSDRISLGSVLESKPVRAVMGLLSLGTSVPIGAYDALRAESGERFTAFKESIKSARGYSDILREHDVDNFWLGFMLDMALDPTTYLSFGVLGATKVPGKGGKMIQKVIASNAAGGRLIGKKSIMGAGRKPLTGGTQ